MKEITAQPTTVPAATAAFEPGAAASGAAARPAPAAPKKRKLRMPDADPAGGPGAGGEDVLDPDLAELAKAMTPQADYSKWPTDENGFLEELAKQEGVTGPSINRVLEANSLPTAGRDKKTKLRQLLKCIRNDTES